jgi:hypothetical protein
MGFLRENIWRAAALALAGIVLALLAQVHGLPLLGGGLKADLAEMTNARDAEIRAHRETKDVYRAAQAEAALQQTFRNARVKAQQERISADAEASANRRLDDLRRRYDGLLAQARAGAAGAAGGQHLPGLSGAAGGADEAARPHGLPEAGLTLAERYQCSVSATQLDELISWIELQAAIDVNAKPED